MKSTLIISALVAYTSAHGLVRTITGANGVTMPGLSVQDGTPRDCDTNGCGSQADSSIIRDRDIDRGKASALGRTQGAGPVDPATMVNMFLGGTAGNATAAPASAAQVAQDLQEDPDKKIRLGKRRDNKGGDQLETIVGSMAGAGATTGLPAVGADGVITMTYYQVNGDGAGPITAVVDGTSGGADASAMQDATVMTQVPGTRSRSDNSQAEFPIAVQMPAGMTCDGTVGQAQNVCVVRVRNDAGAGPFGGSAVFQQTTAARKRAIAYRLRKRMEIRGGKTF